MKIKLPLSTGNLTYLGQALHHIHNIVWSRYSHSKKYVERLRSTAYSYYETLVLAMYRDNKPRK